MNKKTTTHIVLLTSCFTILFFCMMACIQKKPKEIMGYAPVYGNPTQMHIIQSEAARAIVHGGKIYQYLNTTFQIENGEGIHVINSNNPALPQKIGFITVPGCSDISIKNNILYTNNFQDLVGINISSISAVSVASRIEKVFPNTSQDYPPAAGVYFECVDESLGTVIGWTEELLTDPKCKR